MEDLKISYYDDHQRLRLPVSSHSQNTCIMRQSESPVSHRSKFLCYYHISTHFKMQKYGCFTHFFSSLILQTANRHLAQFHPFLAVEVHDHLIFQNRFHHHSITTTFPISRPLIRHTIPINKVSPTQPFRAVRCTALTTITVISNTSSEDEVT